MNGKTSFTERLKRRAREFVALGQVLVKDPRAFPPALLVFLRRSVRTMWDARGGGLYACGFVITFVWLELRLLIGELSASSGIGDFVSEQLLEFIFRFTFASIGNSLQAFVWPILIIEIAPPWGALVLVAMFYLFPRYLKKPLERWLFADGPSTKD